MTSAPSQVQTASPLSNSVCGSSNPGHLNCLTVSKWLRVNFIIFYQVREVENLNSLSSLVTYDSILPPRCNLYEPHISVLQVVLNVICLQWYPHPIGLRAPKLSKSRITATPECSKPINLDTDKVEQIPFPSCYPLDAWSVSF